MLRLTSMIVHWILLALLSVFLYLCAYLPRFATEFFYYPLARVWCKIYVRALGVDLKLHHMNERPLPERYILIANHPSSMEDFGVPSLFKIHALAKRGVRDWLFVGKIADRIGTIFFDRENPDSRHSAKDAMIQALQDGKNIVLFPEGGCKGKRIFKEFQTGAFEASLKTGLPIIPLFLHYEAQETFEWLDESLIENIWAIMTTKNNKVNYYVYDALYPEDFEDKHQFAEHAHSLYLEWQHVHLD